MPANLDALAEAPRLLMEASVRPIQGQRFQPTGFPDLGPATYTLPDGTEMLLVESAQSMANRLEAVCWDDPRDDVVAELRGMPYISIDAGDYGKTSSILEFHRLNSPYIWQGAEVDDTAVFRQQFQRLLGVKQRRRKKGQQADATDGDKSAGAVDPRKLAAAALRYDPNSVLHGVFLEKVAGGWRLPRLLSAFVEARNVRAAESGGVKFDRVFPGKVSSLGIGSDVGYTNVPFPRTEFTAEGITAYFNLDLATMRGYGLGPDAERMLTTLALWKISRFLQVGLRLRTACDFDCDGLTVTRPAGFVIPSLDELSEAIRRDIAACAKARLFVDPPVTEITWKPPPKTASKKVSGEEEPAADEDAE